MTSRRRRLAATTIAATAVLTLGACSGSSEPSPEADSTPSTDADGYTAEEREVVEAVTAYTDALIGYQKGDRDIDLTTVATAEMADGIVSGVKESLDDRDYVMIGDYELTVDTVTVSNDTASLNACNDASGLFLVPEGEDTAGVGSERLEPTRITYELAREGESWVVSDATPDGSGC